jgi:hypothetical protein
LFQNCTKEEKTAYKHLLTKNSKTNTFLCKVMDSKYYLRERAVMGFPVITGELSPSATLWIKGWTSPCSHSGTQDL